MDSAHYDPKRINIVNGDGLSSLPDDLIHKILSSFNIKFVIEISVLSSRWRYIWTSMTYLNFSRKGFPSLRKLYKFVTHVLSHRCNEIDVSSVKLSFCGKASQMYVKRILNYVFSHNVQHMTVSYLLHKNVEFPLSFFPSHSLKHLTLSGDNANGYFPITLTSSTWELPALTTLHLSFIIFDDVITDKCVGLFSKCTNLRNLTLHGCSIVGSVGFSICHPQLSNLTFENEHRFLRIVSVVAPQLKSLSLALNYYHYLQFFFDSLPALERVDLRINDLYMTDCHKLVGLLQEFQSVKYLTLNFEIIQALTSSLELISNQPSPFANLKSLKIYPVNTHSSTHTRWISENLFPY